MLLMRNLKKLHLLYRELIQPGKLVLVINQTKRKHLPGIKVNLSGLALIQWILFAVLLLMFQLEVK